MRKCLLLFVILGLFVSAVFAFERPLSPAMQERLDRARTELSRIVPIEQVKYLPENALPARAYHLYKLIQRVEGSLHKQDSQNITKQVTAFFLEKQIMTSEEWDGSQWVNYYRNTITFNANGMPLEFLGEDWDNSMWNIVARTTYTYDSYGNAVTYTWEVDFGGTGILTPLARWTATVDGNGFVTEIVYQTWTGSAWMDTGRDLYTNDANGLPLITLYQTWSGSTWENSDQYLTTWDGNGNITEDIYQVWNGSSWDNSARWTYGYNGQGAPLWDLSQTWNNGWEHVYQSLYEYDGAGNITSWTGQQWNGSSWDDNWRDLYAYSGSDPIEYIYQEHDGQAWVNAFRETYTYPTAKAAGLGDYKWPETEIGFNWNGSGWDFSWRVDRTFYDMYHPHVAIYKDYNPGTSGWDNSWRDTYEYIQSTGVEDDIVLPQSFTLSNYPNPFNPETTIQFTLPEAAQVTVMVYDITGALIRTLKEDVRYSAGAHHIVWDGMNSAGQPVASGVYLYRLQSEQFTETKRCVLMK